MAIDRFRGKYRFLSNFYPCYVEFEGLSYSSSEHAFQAAKSKDPSYRFMVQSAKTPAEAKQMGRTVKLLPYWDDIRINVMTTILYDKFGRDVELQWKLLKTGEEELIEGNTWGDTFWGVCNGVGQNYLGITLMQIRKEMRAWNIKAKALAH